MKQFKTALESVARSEKISEIYLNTELYIMGKVDSMLSENPDPKFWHNPFYRQGFQDSDRQNKS